MITCMLFQFSIFAVCFLLLYLLFVSLQLVDIKVVFDRESVRGGQTVSYFLSPKAKIFPCRRLALKYLMEVIMPLIWYCIPIVLKDQATIRILT